GTAAGLIRNLDTSADQIGLNQGVGGLNFQTFPLDDSAAKVTTCPATMDGPDQMPADACYLGHVGEAVEATGRTEWACFNTPQEPGAHALSSSHTAVVHGIALEATEIAQF